MSIITPSHITMNKNDADGNFGKGRFFIIPGSSSRSKWIANTYLTEITIKNSNRGHDVYLGKYNNIDIGVVSTGMGCPSLDIIVTELILLGVKYFLRIGTCGSMNDDLLPIGNVGIASASVRDEHTSLAYLPIEFPAIADYNLLNYLSNTISNSRVGIFHTKDSLYAREYNIGPKSKDNKEYIDILKKSKCIASEMETSHLFTLGTVHDVICGSVCLAIGSEKDHFGLPENKKKELMCSLLDNSLTAIRNYVESLPN